MKLPLRVGLNGDVSRRALVIIGIALIALLPWKGSRAENVGLNQELTRETLERYGRSAVNRLLAWQSLINSGMRYSEIEKLARVNSFFNSLRIVEDKDHWGKEDYWSTPVETLSTNGGDCEDLAIAKYFTLKKMRVPKQKLRITYVKAAELNQSHMVLAYYSTEDAEPLILDNLIGEIKPASARTDLVPIYAFNGDGLWLSMERGQGRRVGGVRRVGLWHDLMLRIGSEQGH